jgi:hypothetical protein
MWNLLAAIENAQGKAAGIFPPLAARALADGLQRGAPRVHWRQPPGEAEFRSGIKSLIDSIFA